MRRGSGKQRAKTTKGKELWVRAVVCVAMEEVEDVRNAPVDEEDGYDDDQAGEELALSSAMARATTMGCLGLDLPGGGGAGRNEGEKGNPREALSYKGED